MTAAQRVVYYSTSTKPLPLEAGEVLTIGERVTLTGEPYGNAIAYIETGALVEAPADEQPKPAKSSASKSTDEKGA